MLNTGKERFPFGENWLDFLAILSDEHIFEAEKALCAFVGDINLKGKRFLDIGSGSGLHSLAARKMGAEVVSFDYDLQSVACTKELKSRSGNSDNLAKTWNTLHSSYNARAQVAFKRFANTSDLNPGGVIQNRYSQDRVISRTSPSVTPGYRAR